MISRLLILAVAAAVVQRAAPTSPRRDADRASQTQELQRGQVIERVTCRTNPEQSYALYLPAGYSPDRKWPILYAFDPGARGPLPVQRFKTAAERYGYIVVGSNNSHNGPMTIAAAALAAMTADTASRFSLDERRIYFTGFSGGARMAVAAGYSLRRAAGVIGCGAGFPPAIQPSAAVPFSYAGIVGIDDFNYPELKALDETLGRLGVAHRLEVFPGPHEWPPEAACMRAVEWMELQAMRTSIRDRDERLIDGMLTKRSSEAAAENSAGRPYEAFLRYSEMASDFAGLRDVTAFDHEARELAQSKNVKSAIAEERNSLVAQRGLETKISRLMNDALTADDRVLAGQELVDAMEDVRRQAARPTSDATRIAARRVAAWAWIHLNEAAGQDLERGDMDQAATRLELMTRIRPDNVQAPYQLARVCARAGKRKAAVEALRLAVRRGFRDLAALEGEADFAPLRADEGFVKIVDGLKKTR